MAADTTSRQNRGIITVIYDFLFYPTENEDVKQHKKNLGILMQNQNLQQSFIETNDQTNNITCIQLS